VTRLVGTYVLPTPIGLLPGCFGKRYATRLWGRRVVMSLPRLEWDELIDKPAVIAPTIDDLPTSQGSGVAIPGVPPDAFDWGQVNHWWSNSRRLPGAWLNTVALEFTLPDGDIDYYQSTRGLGAPTGPMVQSLFKEVDPWFQRLLEWVGVAVDQDTDYRDPPKGSSVAGLGLTLRAIGPDGQRSSARSANMIAVHGGSSTLLTLDKFRRVVSQTNRGQTPSDSRLLLRDAYLDLRRGRLRKAVIDAGSATELVLGSWNQANQLPVRARATLGEHVDKTTAPIPGDSRPGLVQIRNDAIHNNLVPTRAQAQRALEIAKAVLDLLEPLPL
jgi:hypothetical protein